LVVPVSINISPLTGLESPKLKHCKIKNKKSPQRHRGEREKRRKRESQKAGRRVRERGSEERRGDKGIGKGNVKSSFSLSSLHSPRLCGEIFYSGSSYYGGLSDEKQDQHGDMG
jgi:hypothetical protein